MSAKEDLFAAARSLRDAGHENFTVDQIMSEARQLGSTYADATLRTMTTQHLRIDKGLTVGGIGFVKAGRGYRLVDSNATNRDKVLSSKIGSTDLPIDDVDTGAPKSSDAHEWFWEGNIQAALVRHLASERWQIRRVANTLSREHGIDIEADRDGVSLLIEVKGYPSTKYSGGPNEGRNKNSGVGAQARHYFGGAVLAGLLMRSENKDARVVLAFPTQETFHGLARRTGDPLRRAGIEIWMVNEHGGVTENVGVERHTS